MAQPIQFANPTKLTEFISSVAKKILPQSVKAGFATAVETMAEQKAAAPYSRYSVFSRQFPEQLAQKGVTIGQKPGEFLGAYAARVLTDVGTDSSRAIYWRHNHPMALADRVVEKVAGASYADLDPTQKALVGLAVGAPVAASLGTMDLTNPGELFRPKGFAQTYAEEGSADRRETSQPGLEFVERVVLGRQGRPLKYETAQEDIPSLTPERYSRYMQGYYQDRGLAGLGLVKFTPENLEGYPEARIVGFPVGLQAAGALTGGATAMRQALRQPGLSTGAKAGITLAGSLIGAATGNLINKAIASSHNNPEKLPSTYEYQQNM